MANLYAQATANWNAASQWNTAANGSGSFQTPAAGDVCYANNFTITINISVDISPSGQIRTDAGAGTAGGLFQITTTGLTLKADIFAGTTNCFSFSSSSGSTTITGNCTGGASTSAYAVRNANSATLNVTGNVNGGSANAAYGVQNSFGGTCNITGTVTGGSTSGANGANNNAAGTIAITGSVVGGTVSSSAYGVNNNSTGIITVTANSTGGTGGAPGIFNATTGSVTISGLAIGNDYGGAGASTAAAPGVVSNASGSVTKVGGIQYGTNGQSPTQGPVKLIPASTNTAVMVNSTSGTTTLVPQVIFVQTVLATVESHSGTAGY